MSSDFKAKQKAKKKERNTVSDEGDSKSRWRDNKAKKKRRNKKKKDEGRKQDYFFSKCQVVLEQKVLFSFQFQCDNEWIDLFHFFQY